MGDYAHDLCSRIKVTTQLKGVHIMRTLISSILVLGLSAQPILAQRVLSDLETYSAIRIGEKVCAMELKTGTSVEVLLPQEIDNIPSQVKRNSVMLDEYFEVLKMAYMNCIAKNLLRQVQDKDKK